MKTATVLLIVIVTILPVDLSYAQDNCDLLLHRAIMGQLQKSHTGSAEAEVKLQSFRERANNVNGNLKAATTLAADFLDVRDSLIRSVPAVAGGPASHDPTTEILSKLRDLTPLGFHEPDWKRADLLANYPNVAGFLEEPNYTTLYLQGAKQHAVRVYKDGRVSLVDPLEATKEYQSYCQREVKVHSTPDMSLFDVARLPDGSRELFINDRRAVIAPNDYLQIKSGRALPENHPLTQALLSRDGEAKVMYSDPFMQKAGPTLREADDFVFALQKAYPHVPIYRDPYSARTNELVKQLNRFSVSGPSDIIAIVADSSFQPRVKDYKIIQNLKQQLAAANISVVSYSPNRRLALAGDKGKGLIVITGHSSEELAAFVHDLGSQGAFDGKYVMFNSCETPLSRQLITEINTRYKAAGTFAHEGKVMVNDLDGFMRDFSASLVQHGRANFRDLIMQNLLKHNLNGVWTICAVERFHVFGDWSRSGRAWNEIFSPVFSPANGWVPA